MARGELGPPPEFLLAPRNDFQNRTCTLCRQRPESHGLKMRTRTSAPMPAARAGNAVETATFLAGYLTTNLISAPATIFCPATGCWATTIEAGDGAPACGDVAAFGEFVWGEFAPSIIAAF
jgi:hypothetical protein